MKNFASESFVIFDVETTGLSPKRGDRMIEIAGLKVQGGEVVECFQSLLNPGRPVSYGAFLVNGISDKMLLHAPAAGDVIPQFLSFARGSYLVGHNVRFDLSFLSQEMVLLDKNGEASSDRVALDAIDTVRMARGLLPDLGRYSLAAVAQFLGVEAPQEHRALPDAQMTAQVFLQLLAMADRKDITDVGMLLSLFGAHRRKNPDVSGRLQEIRAALRSQTAIRIVYAGARDVEISFEVIVPLRLERPSRRWILKGRDPEGQRERSFSLERILRITAESTRIAAEQDKTSSVESC